MKLFYDFQNSTVNAKITNGYNSVALIVIVFCLAINTSYAQTTGTNATAICTDNTTQSNCAWLDSLIGKVYSTTSSIAVIGGCKTAAGADAICTFLGKDTSGKLKFNCQNKPSACYNQNCNPNETANNCQDITGTTTSGATQTCTAAQQQACGTNTSCWAFQNGTKACSCNQGFNCEGSASVAAFTDSTGATIGSCSGNCTAVGTSGSSGSGGTGTGSNGGGGVTTPICTLSCGKPPGGIVARPFP